MNYLNKISINGLNKGQASNIAKKSSSAPALNQLQCDTVSFTGKEDKIVQTGTDVLLGIVRKCQDLLQKGQQEMVAKTMSLVEAGKVNEALEELNKCSLPNGIIEPVENGTKIIARNWDGSEVEHVFHNVDGFKNLGLVKNIDDAGRIEIYDKAFGVQPKTTVGMVGWTNIKPETVQGGTELSKAQLTEKYESALEKFYAPVDRYFMEGLGINPSDRALVSSVSYSGVDKAIMDLGQNKGINTLTITPFDYSIYGRNEHPFPTIITDTIPQYVQGYGKLSDNIIVTGGRDHAFKFDAGGKWLRQTNGQAIPVDVLKDYEGIVVPATIDGKIENAAALAYETFSDPLPAGLVAGFKELPADSLKQELQHPAQQALATAMYRNMLARGFALK